LQLQAQNDCNFHCQHYRRNSLNISFGSSDNVSAHVLAKISSTDKLSTCSRSHFYSAEQRVNERATMLTYDQMMFILGGENIMYPDQTFK
jgi:hypothetical protein